jgi:glutaredoxin
MKKALVLHLVLWGLAAPLGAAQLYRWVDEKGNVEWRDTPPPPTAKKVEQHKVGSGPVPAPEMPYSLRQAVQNFPVTLWINDCGDACDKARAHLGRRGVPHSVKNPQSNFEAFRNETGGNAVPVLFVGSRRVTGYEETQWDAALDFGGYPKTALFKPPAQKPAPGPAVAVRLYTSPQCGATCEEAKKLLANRKVAFKEIVVESPATVEELRKLTGDNSVPTLAAGRFVVRGFDTALFDSALDQAGFKREQAATP